MGCTAFCVHHGPSVYSHQPVIRYTLASPLAGGLPPHRISIGGRLFTLLPGLREHCAPCGGHELFDGNGGAAPATFPHLFEHLCIELQNLAGAKLCCVRAEAARLAGDDAVIPYEDERIGLEAGALSLDLIDALTSPHRAVDLQGRLREFLGFAERHRFPLQDYALIRAAEARDIPVLRMAGRLIQFGHGCRQQRMNGTETSRTTTVSNDLAANKDYARRVLQAAGLPVPRYERVHRREEAVAAALRIGPPVVVKPNRSNLGNGVSVHLRTEDEVRDAFDRTRGHGRSTLVEEFVPGADYRLLVINGRLEAAVRRVPPLVVGDGTQTIQELVRQTNLDPRRVPGHNGALVRIELDEESDRLLAELGYDRRSVAREGETVVLRRVANISAGGTAVDVTDQVHPENREIAERAARVIGLDVAGVDLLVEDISRPMRAQGGVIGEINSRPGLQPHTCPVEGQARDVIAPIVEMLFPSGSPSRIPIAVVTGRNDGSAARLLAERLAADGSTVGLVTDDGVFIDGTRADGGGMKGPPAVRMLLLDPSVERAVVVVPPSEAFQCGLGYDWADACAVLNDQPLESPALVEGLRLVAASARSHLILTAGDEETYQLKPHPGARVWHASPDGDGPAFYAQALARCLGRPPEADSLM